MADAKKPGLEVVLGLGDKGKSEPAPGPDDSMGGKTDAAQAVIEAIDTKDAGALSEALQAFFDLADRGDVVAEAEPKGL